MINEYTSITVSRNVTGSQAYNGFVWILSLALIWLGLDAIFSSKPGLGIGSILLGTSFILMNLGIGKRSIGSLFSRKSDNP
jgi:hypothetical protein